MFFAIKRGIITKFKKGVRKENMENIFMNTYLEACKELQVNPNDKEEEIKKKYHDLLKKFHPDNKKEFANTEKVKKLLSLLLLLKSIEKSKPKTILLQIMK